jgi:hypothetical protein
MRLYIKYSFFYFNIDKKKKNKDFLKLNFHLKNSTKKNKKAVNIVNSNGFSWNIFKICRFIYITIYGMR